MARILYELAGKDGHRFSPYCWRTRMALAHMGLAADLVAVPFTDKSAIDFSGQGKVPVLDDDGKCIFDSWTIACYLEDTYANGTSLFGGEGGRNLARFINHWCDRMVHAAVNPLMIGDIPAALDPIDAAFFRKTRGERLANFITDAPGRDAGRIKLAQVLTPARELLAERPYLSGEAPAYADYILFGSFQWARCVSPVSLLAMDDPVYAWRDRMLGLFDGLAGKAPGFPV